MPVKVVDASALAAVLFGEAEGKKSPPGFVVAVWLQRQSCHLSLPIPA